MKEYIDSLIKKELKRKINERIELEKKRIELEKVRLELKIEKEKNRLKYEKYFNEKFNKVKSYDKRFYDLSHKNVYKEKETNIYWMRKSSKLYVLD